MLVDKTISMYQISQNHFLCQPIKDLVRNTETTVYSWRDSSRNLQNNRWENNFRYKPGHIRTELALYEVHELRVILGSVVSFLKAKQRLRSLELSLVNRFKFTVDIMLLHMDPWSSPPSRRHQNEHQFSSHNDPM